LVEHGAEINYLANGGSVAWHCCWKISILLWPLLFTSDDMKHIAGGFLRLG